MNFSLILRAMGPTLLCLTCSVAEAQVIPVVNLRVSSPQVDEIAMYAHAPTSTTPLVAVDAASPNGGSFIVYFSNQGCPKAARTQFEMMRNGYATRTRAATAIYCRGDIYAYIGQGLDGFADDLKNERLLIEVARGQTERVPPLSRIALYRFERLSDADRFVDITKHLTVTARPAPVTLPPAPVTRPSVSANLPASRQHPSRPFGNGEITSVIVDLAVEIYGGRRGSANTESIVPSPLGGDLWHIFRSSTDAKCVGTAVRMRCTYIYNKMVVPDSDSMMAKVAYVSMRASGEDTTTTRRTDDFIKVSGRWQSPTLRSWMREPAASSPSAPWDQGQSDLDRRREECISRNNAAGAAGDINNLRTCN